MLLLNLTKSEVFVNKKVSYKCRCAGVYPTVTHTSLRTWLHKQYVMVTFNNN